MDDTFYQLAVSGVTIFVRTIDAVTNRVIYMQKILAKLVLLTALLHRNYPKLATVKVMGSI